METNCKICRKSMTVHSDPDCPPEWSAVFLPMVICMRCDEFRERRENVTERIKRVCERLAGLGEVTAEVRKTIREKLLAATREFAQIQSDFHRAPSVMWTPEFTDMLMDQPLKWGMVLNVYRNQFKQWLRQYREEVNA
jgi:hypothetical protein